MLVISYSQTYRNNRYEQRCQLRVKDSMLRQQKMPIRTRVRAAKQYRRPVVFKETQRELNSWVETH